MDGSAGKYSYKIPFLDSFGSITELRNRELNIRINILIN